MNTLNKRKLGKTLFLALAAAGIAQACGKDTPPDSDAPVITGGSSGNSGAGGKGGTGNQGGTAGTDNPGGETSGGTSGTTGSGGSSDTGGSAGKGGTGGTGNEGGSGNEGGAGPDGCVRNPTAPEDFLIRCTNSRCAPFDNSLRIPDFDGTLPDL